MHGKDRIWQEWWAWFPVIATDDGLCWLEFVWRKREPVRGSWIYRTFRTPTEKEAAAARREI